MGKWTPGPWAIKFSSSGYPMQIHATDESLRRKPGAIYDVTRWGSIGMPSGAEGKANARLIAEAPAMAEALREAIDEYAGLQSSLGYEFTHLEKWRAILARIDGEAK